MQGTTERGKMMEESAQYFISDEMDDELEEEEFMILNDQAAEWSLLRLKEDKEEMNRFVDVCEKQIEFYEAKIRIAKERYENKTGYLKGKLMEYFLTVPHKNTKTQETYSLPSGKLKLKYPKPEYKRDDGTLLNWLKARDMTDYIKVSESPQWGELKKTVQVAGDKACIDGEIIDGIQVVGRQPVFDVEI